MTFQLRDALKLGSVHLSTHFFSLKLGVNDAKKQIRDELTRFAIIVEPPKTMFGKTRRTYTGKIGGENASSPCAFGCVSNSYKKYISPSSLPAAHRTTLLSPFSSA